MRINLLLVVIAGLVTLTGCVSADMVSSPGVSSAFAPINASTRPGLVKYLNDGAAFVREKRRRMHTGKCTTLALVNTKLTQKVHLRKEGPL